MDLTRQEFERAQDLLLAAIKEVKTDVLLEVRGRADGIDERLDKLNSKTTTHGEKIAVLEERSQTDFWARAIALVSALMGGYGVMK